MPFPLLGALIGLGAGGLKHLAVDQPMYNRKKKTAAEQNLFSGWTNKSYDYPDAPNPFNTMFNSGLTGAAFEQGLARDEAFNKYLGGKGAAGAAEADFLKSQTPVGRIDTISDSALMRGIEPNVIPSYQFQEVAPQSLDLDVLLNRSAGPMMNNREPNMYGGIQNEAKWWNTPMYRR